MIILNILLQAIKIILLLSLLVIMHEGAHFFVAKCFKMRVREFGIGFGKKLWSKMHKGTLYTIRILPLGGFVDLDDDNRDGAFSKSPLYQKNLVLCAGVFVNLVFALIVAFFVLVAQGNFVSNNVISFSDVSNADEAGIRVGDKVIQVEGKNINTKSQIDNIMVKNTGEDVILVVERNGQQIDLIVKPYKKDYITTGFTINTEQIVTTSRNENIKLGDKLVSINDIKMNDNESILNELSNYIDQNIQVEFIRNNELVKTEIKVIQTSRYYIGVLFENVEDTLQNRVEYAFIGTTDFLYETIVGLIDLITGNNKNAELIGIVGVSDIISKTDTVKDYFAIMASVSLSLAIINLLPLPLLDGGKILIYTIERYRKKQFSDFAINLLSFITLVLLIALTVYVTIKDIIRIF